MNLTNYYTKRQKTEDTMSIESDLRKDGIRVVDILDTMSVNRIAHNIAAKLCDTFPELCFNESDLFAKLSRLNMYRATMPDGMAEGDLYNAFIQELETLHKTTYTEIEGGNSEIYDKRRFGISGQAL